MIQGHAARDAVGARDADFGHLVVFFFKTRYLPHFKLHFPVFAEFLHAGHRTRRSAETVATMHEDDAFGFADEI